MGEKKKGVRAKSGGDHISSGMKKGKKPKVGARKGDFGQTKESGGDADLIREKKVMDRGADS